MGTVRTNRKQDKWASFESCCSDCHIGILVPIIENQTEKNMEHEMESLGPLEGVYRGITPIMENQMENNM